MTLAFTRCLRPDRLVKATDRVRRCLPPAAGMSGLCARRSPAHRLPHLPGQAPRRWPGRLHPPPDQGARRPRPPRRGARRPAVPGARPAGAAASSCRASTSTTTTIPCGFPASGSSSTGRTSSRSPSSRPARSPSRSPSACGPGSYLDGRKRRVRPRPRQPVPRLRPAWPSSGSAAGARHAPPPDHRRPAPRDRARAERGASARRVRRWYAFIKMQTRVARQLPRIITVSENSIDDIHARPRACRSSACTRARRRRPRALPAAARRRARARPAHHHGQRRRHA